MLERLKEALPHLPDDHLSTLGISRDPRSESGFVALPCSHHRIALAILMTTHKYLTDIPLRNRQWHAITGGIFDKEDILAMEVQFLLRMVGFDLFISEQDIIDRFYMLIYPAGDRRSRFHPDNLRRIQDYIQRTATVAPLTPISPQKCNAHDGSVEAVPAAASTAVAEPVDTSFVLQPVPGNKKRGPRVVEDSLTSHIPASQSSWNLTLPLSDSTSSDCLLKVVSSYAMDDHSNFSSSNTGTSMTNTSTSASATSSVHTPADRPAVTHSTSSSQSSTKASSRHRRSTLSVLDGSPHSSVMAKVLGVGRALSPSRVGHVIKGGNRKVSTATTIVPNKVGHH
ncbi:hypothetical protein M408DRAFT_326302 [Serendipita vermifera MAFF 305830]|uniref:Cyclin N-terminal domain-containing protein n=1 Tax=Serendipita vermifera MAFF 305830 TaxID=933852 RepID=A0A0C3BA02_SERVB|nr:hypothetical protein M408DRAFT_326302 [Serendipita vermifera MAFF 305830]